MRRFIYIILFTLLLSSCFKPDEVLPRTKTAETIIYQNIEGNQSSYLNLEELQSEYLAVEPSWHLKFQNSKDGWSIFLNSLNKVSVHNTRITDFDKVNGSHFEQGLEWQVDIPTPEGLQPALGTWGDFSFPNPKSFKDVHLILWKNDSATKLYKLQVLDASMDAYHLRYGPLNSDTTFSVWIDKNNNYTHSYFSFDQNDQVHNVEPQVSDWNICFTYFPDSIHSHRTKPEEYTLNSYFGIYRGVRVNHDHNHIFMDTLANYNDIDYFYASKLDYQEVDQLYNTFTEWNESDNTLSVASNHTLIIKNEDKFFAMRATGIQNWGSKDFTITLEVKQL